MVAQALNARVIARMVSVRVTESENNLTGRLCPVVEGFPEALYGPGRLSLPGTRSPGPGPFRPAPRVPRHSGPQFPGPGRYRTPVAGTAARRRGCLAGTAPNPCCREWPGCPGPWQVPALYSPGLPPADRYG